MPKATAVFDADDSRLGAALIRINQRMLALQSRINDEEIGLFSDTVTITVS
jgi:hypothetical protein